MSAVVIVSVLTSLFAAIAFIYLQTFGARHAAVVCSQQRRIGAHPLKERCNGSITPSWRHRKPIGFRRTVIDCVKRSRI